MRICDSVQVTRGSWVGAGTIGALVLSLFSFNLTLISAQTTTIPKSPLEVLKAYRKMDGEGGRLTASGWHMASKFFVKPARAPRHYVLEVIGGEAVDGGFPWPDGAANRFRIHVSVDARGHIDSSGRFTSVLDQILIDPSGTLLTQPAHPRLRGQLPLVQIYDLALTDAYWELGPNREDPIDLQGPPAWLVESSAFEAKATIELALR